MEGMPALPEGHRGESEAEGKENKKGH